VLIVSAMESRIQQGVEVLAKAYGLEVIGRLKKPLSFKALHDVPHSAPTTGDGTARLGLRIGHLASPAI
jgi:hypothetical protein